MFSVAVIVLSCLLSCGSGDRPPSVVLVIIDTLRADHLSCYGYDRATSPNIDSLAAAGTTWGNTFSQSSWTLPATASIWSGLSPKSHGATMNVGTGEVFGMDPGMPVLPMILKSHGYRTAGFLNVYLLGPDFGFHRGFDTYECDERGDGLAGETVDRAIEWLTDLQDDESFLLVVHFFDVHDPYDPPAPFDTLFCPGGAAGETYWDFAEGGRVARPEQCGHLMGLYDGEIAWVDCELGRLFGALRSLGLSDSTLVILTADHGEEFLDHGYVGHGRTLYQETVHVPIIMSGPGVRAGEVRSETVGQIDILPTIMDHCGIAAPEGLEGVSLLEPGLPADRILPASEINTGLSFNIASVTDGSEKLIWNADTDSIETYDLQADPGEMHPVHPDSGLLDSVLYYWATPCRWRPVPLEAWRVEPVLRDLGYI